ncbi:MAG: hypothetical protein QOI45_567 [Thermoleophilaceae bacterium]|nr:hypothetical protein [Thermoleophilaceae bacterium]
MTYSIVARDEDSGQLGVAVQSHYFSVGSLVSWADPGVGAVATQSVVEPAYGPRGLGLMRRGSSAPEALRRLLLDDDQQEVRQVAVVDARGRAAVHTGSRCIREAGHRVADGVSVQANMMERATVPDAMLEAYRSTSGELADRLLAALDAAEREGGDIRGRQSAALTVVAPRATGQPSEDRPVDLRVEDHSDPLAELRRLVDLRRTYMRVELGDELAAAGDVDGALEQYAAAHAEQPEDAELAFWHGVALAANGHEREAGELLEIAYADREGWRELLRRLPQAGLFPDDEALVGRITAEGGPGPGGEANLRRGSAGESPRL